MQYGGEHVVPSDPSLVEAVARFVRNQIEASAGNRQITRRRSGLKVVQIVPGFWRKYQIQYPGTIQVGCQKMVTGFPGRGARGAGGAGAAVSPPCHRVRESGRHVRHGDVATRATDADTDDQRVW